MDVAGLPYESHHKAGCPGGCLHSEKVKRAGGSGGAKEGNVKNG